MGRKRDRHLQSSSWSSTDPFSASAEWRGVSAVLAPLHDVQFENEKAEEKTRQSYLVLPGFSQLLFP